MHTFYWLLLAGLLIILALATYALVLWRRVWQQRTQRQQAVAQRDERLAGDIRFIAQSLLDSQVPMIEGAIRIKVLLDNYQGERREDLDVQIFEYLYDQTAHIPTHENWKALSQAQRQLHLRLMETLERDHREDVVKAAQALAKGLT